MNSYHLKISISKSENISPYKKDPVPNKEWAVFVINMFYFILNTTLKFILILVVHCTQIKLPLLYKTTVIFSYRLYYELMYILLYLAPYITKR